jgi:hypothetical protein
VRANAGSDFYTQTTNLLSKVLYVSKLDYTCIALVPVSLVSSSGTRGRRNCDNNGDR